MKRSIKPPSPTPTPAPEPSPVPAPEPEVNSREEKVRFQCWHPSGPKGYWQRPARKGETRGGIVQAKPVGEGKGVRIVISAACGSDYSYDRIYIENGIVHALTLGLAAEFDEGKHGQAAA